jgi:hypothetical protein
MCGSPSPCFSLNTRNFLLRSDMRVEWAGGGVPHLFLRVEFQTFEHHAGLGHALYKLFP